ncbi:Transposon Tf2-6 polyprotein [Caligus rogercresseyi]|uniref:Transposon Tf2-6 polyprotein n=1 Tax=Caligus rogercresseyi TaxID=217165 RepID=A0A7T8KJW9_CALRO|nr:Transposon Tf2-6 polyprotein [Caligus rogercresseyi]
MDVPHLKSPEGMDLADFRDWRERFEDYSAVTRLAEDDEATQRGILRSALHEDWTKMWSEGTIKVPAEAGMAAILDILYMYLRRHRHVLLDRQAFLEQNQCAGETVDQYCTVLRQLDRSCTYDHTCEEQRNRQDERLRDRLVTGLLESSMRKEVLKTPLSDLTLETTLTICRSVESSCATNTRLGSNGPKGISKVSQSTYKKEMRGRYVGKQHEKSDDFQRNTPSDQCKACLRAHDEGKCKAKALECYSCGRNGHVAASSMCKSKKDVRTSNSIRLGNICINSVVEEEGLVRLETRHRGRFANALPWLPDTGARADAMSLDHVNLMKGKGTFKVERDTSVLLGPDDRRLKTHGVLPVELRLGSKSYMTRVHILDEANSPLLSKQGCQALGLIPIACQQCKQ